jgi:hypothetical protein
LPGLHEENMLRQIRIGNLRPDAPGRIEQRGAKLAKGEAAAQPRFLALVPLLIAPGVAPADAAQSFRGDVARDGGVHFHEDDAAVAAVLMVHLQHGVTGGAAAREGVEHQVAGVGGKLNHSLDQTNRFRSLKCCSFTQYFL